ncbi:MAG: cardiolipin synthase [Candidatus Izimaplasma sp.]|nr:cardiolipin synthase [Candidatus Izimaplasma bacterium]
MNNNIKRNIWVVLIILVAIGFRVGFEVAINLLRFGLPNTQIFTYFLRYLVVVISIIIWIRIATRTHYHNTKLIWLLALVIDPFTGLFLFLTFGRDYKESNRYKNHPLIKKGVYLTQEDKTDFHTPELSYIDDEITDIYKTAYNMTNHSVFKDNTSVELLRNGEVFFPRLKEELKIANSFILFQFFTIRTDETGKEILDLLKEKVQQGIEVKVIYDAIGSVFLNKKYLKSLKEAGVEINAIDPVYFGFFNTKVNYRNHRKSVIIDGKVAFLGGMNIADEYWNRTKGYPKFRDTQLLIKGKAITSLTALFFRDYYYITNDFIDDDKYYPKKVINKPGLVQLIPSGPEYVNPTIRNVYVKMINNAKKSIKIMTPYLVLDEELRTSLIIASRSDVNVEIILPGVPDKKWIYFITNSNISTLIDKNIKIYKYKDTFTHAKVLIIDDRLASCGTYNLDNRSAHINFEATLLLYKEGVQSLVNDFENDLKNCHLVDYEKWKNRSIFIRLTEALFNILTPLA